MTTLTIDKYTKGVLTIIAIALMIIALKGTELFPKAFAAVDTQKVQICDTQGDCAGIKFGRLHVHTGL